MPIEPDTKDWTWVLETPCGDCGFDSVATTPSTLGESVRSNADAWHLVLSGDASQLAVRPRESVWSTLEYACHVRDVHRVFAERLQSMLDHDEPLFANWDQDEAALVGDYAASDPARVKDELVAAAQAVAATYDSVAADPAAAERWERTGRRSNGSFFTVASLGRYHLHDVVHHLHDVGHDPRRVTVAAYDAHAATYRSASLAMNEAVASEIAWFSGETGPGARVLEIGSGGGRDALALEAAGLRVRRTDVSAAFVEMLRAGGHEADRLDPLTDLLDDPLRGEAYDGVWAHACLLHVARADFPVVVRRLAEATRPGGALHISLKEGDGEAWSTHGTVETPRHFVFWREAPLRAALEENGWTVTEVLRHQSGVDQAWLTVRGRRA